MGALTGDEGSDVGVDNGTRCQRNTSREKINLLVKLSK
jgi:hypothetical protein